MLKLLIFFALVMNVFGTENYYCIQNYNLKILELPENNLLFYGDKGGILRSSDEGETWIQNYSGSQSDILKILNKNNILYGITSDGNLMVSNDYGDYWKYHKFDNSLIDLVEYNEILLTLTSENIIYELNLENYSLIEYSKLNDTIQKIYNVNDNLIALTNTNNLLKYNYTSNEWNIIETPEIKNLNINHNNSNIYLYNKNIIANYNGEEWEIDSIDNLLNIYPYHVLNYIFLDNGEFIIFNNLNAARNPKLNINTYNIETKNEISLDSIRLDNFEIGLSFYDRKINDIKKVGNNYYITMRSKTILKTLDFKEFQTVYFLPYNAFNWRNSIFSFLNENKILVNEANLSSNSNISKGHNFLSISNNKGKEFKNLTITNYIERDTLKYSPYFGNLYIKDSIEYLVQTFGGINLLNDNEHFDSSVKYFKTTDGGSSFYPITELMNIQSIKFNINYNDFDLIENFNDTYYFYKLDILNSKTLFNSNNVPLDSIRNHIIYFIDSNNMIDSTKVLPDSLTNFNFYIEDNFIWMYGNRVTSFFEIIDSNTNLSMKKYKNVGGATFKYNINEEKWYLIKNENTPIIYKSKNGGYYYLKDNNLVECDENLNIIKEIKLEVDNIQLYKGEQNKIGFLEDKIFLIEFEEKNKLIKFDLDLKNKFKELDIDYSPEMYLAKDKKSIFYIKDDKFLFIPIEPERLEYYASSVERGGPPPIWTYPPYPNPVKDILKMKFYSAMMNQIANLKVELIEIGSGRTYKIEDYEITKTDDYWGEIIIDVGNYQTGAYLINFKLGDGNKSESIIIE